MGAIQSRTSAASRIGLIKTLRLGLQRLSLRDQASNKAVLQYAQSHLYRTPYRQHCLEEPQPFGLKIVDSTLQGFSAEAMPPAFVAKDMVSLLDRISARYTNTTTSSPLFHTHTRVRVLCDVPNVL